MILTKDEQNLYVLNQLLDRIDAINAAVKGADFADRSHQSGISLLLGDVFCDLSDLIEKMGGKEDVRDEE